MSTLVCVPFGNVGEDVLSAVEEALGDTFNLEIRRMAAQPLPAGMLDLNREQYSSEVLLRTIHHSYLGDSFRMLGITSVDLFIPMLTFVFGQAQLGGRVAVVSTARLQQEFYNMPADTGLTIRRAVKEATHEIGHTFGLTHCVDKRCPMSLSTGVAAIDEKGARLCGSCRIALYAFRDTSNIAKGR